MPSHSRVCDAARAPVVAQVPVIQHRHLRRQPGGHVHAVGDMADGHLFLRLARIQAGPHGAGNFAVQRGNRVGAARKLQPQHGHAEILVRIARIFAAQRHQPVMRQAQSLAQRPQMLLDQSARGSGRGRPAPAYGW